MKQRFWQVLLTLSACAFAGPVSQYGQLQSGINSERQGRIYGSCPTYSTPGKEVQIRGMSLFWAIAPGGDGAQFWTKSYVSGLVQNLNVQLVRAPMGVDEDWGAGNYFNNQSHYQNLMDDVVSAAIENDIYVIIDYHSHKAHENVPNAKKFFEYMAQKWGAYDNVIFEIYNEPIGSYGDYSYWGTIREYATQVIPVIRKYSDNLILVGTPYYDLYPDAALNNPLDDKNIAYTFHYYAGSHSPGTDGARAEKVIKAGFSIFVSEWGTVNANGDGGVAGSNFEWQTWLDKYQLSSANWAVSTKNEGASLFSGSPWNYSASGKWVKENVFSKNPTSYTPCSQGSSSSSSSSSSAISSSSQKEGTTDYIDDFEDGDNIANTGGPWYAYTDKGSKGASSLSNKVDGEDYIVNLTASSDNGSSYMAGITGIKLSKGEYKYDPFVALGLSLNKDESVYNLSACTQFEYRYKGAAHNFKVQTPDVEDFDYHQVSQAASSSWKTVVVPWDYLKQESWGKSVTLKKDRVDKLAWEIKDTTSVDYLYVDDFRCIGMEIVPVIPESSSSSSKPNSSSSSVVSSSSVSSSSSSRPNSSSSSVNSSSSISSSSSKPNSSSSSVNSSSSVSSSSSKPNSSSSSAPNSSTSSPSSSSTFESSSDGQSSSSTWIESSSDTPLGIANNFTQKFGIQLSGRTLFISGGIASIDVFDMQGRPLAQFANIRSASLDFLSPGSYIVRLSTNKQSFVQKISLK